MSEFTHRRIRGTMGGLDYTVVAKNGPVILGLKMLTSSVFDHRAQKNRKVVNLRCRSTFDPDADLPTGDPEEARQLVQGAWPGLDFQVVGDTSYGFRARFHAGLPLFNGANAVAAIDASRFYAKVYAFLAEHVLDPGEFTLSFEDFREALREQAVNLFGEGDGLVITEGSESGASFDYTGNLHGQVNGDGSAFDAGEDVDDDDADGEYEEVQAAQPTLVHEAQDS